MFTRLPIRSQIFSLLAVLVTPLVGILIYDAYERVHLRETEAIQVIQNVANVVVIHVDQLVAQSRSALEVTASLPVIRRMNPDKCEPVLQKMQHEQSVYLNAVIFDANGRLVCTVVDRPPQAAVSSLPWFNAAIREPGFRISEPYLDPLVNEWVSIASYPIYGADGKVVGIFGLAIGLSDLSDRIAEIYLPLETVVVITDTANTIVARSIDADSWIGKDISNSPLAQEMIAAHDEPVQRKGVDGANRLYVNRTGELAGWTVHTGMPLESIRGPVQEQLVRSLTITATVTGIALILAMWLSYLILRPLRRLVTNINERQPEITASGIGSAPPEILSIVNELSDAVEARRDAEEHNRLLAQVFTDADEAMMIADTDVRIVAVNGAFERITGYTEQESLGRNPRLLQSGRHGRDFYRALWGSLETNGRWQGEIWNRRKSGEIFPAIQTISKVCRIDDNSFYYVATMVDISQLRETQEKLEKLRYYDSLTELPNRSLFLDRAEHAIIRCRDEGIPMLVLLVVDLDRFKYVNDTFGHPFGDQVLYQAGRCLVNCVHKMDTVARIGADEFAVLAESIKTQDALLNLIDRIQKSFNKPIAINGQAIATTVCIGAALFPDNASDANDLLRAGEAAMHRAKANKLSYAFYSQDLTEHAYRLLNLEYDLRQAVARNDFTLVYQPQVDFRSGKILGCEALIRWTSAQGEFVPPSEFIPLAEDVGLSGAITQLVLDSACRQLRAWWDADVPISQVGINISSNDLTDPGFVDYVISILNQYDLPHASVELELTEGVLINSGPGGIGQLNALHDHGLRVAIDDFGTGYSSLSYLRLFKANVLKIDRSFVTHLEEDPNSKEIAQAVIALGHSLGMSVLAEGVESENQYDWLKAAGCDVLQGFLFSPPVSPERLGHLFNHVLIKDSTDEQSENSKPD